MDNYDLKPERKKPSRKLVVWNLLTVFVLLFTFCVAYYFLSVFKNPNLTIAGNPNLPLNPFRPPTSAPTITVFGTPTFTATILPLEPTWTPSVTISPVPSRTKAATFTLLPQLITPSVTLTPTITQTPTITLTPMPASAQITFFASTVYHPNTKCNWLGVAGKVLGTDGKPLLNQQIFLGGTLDGTSISFATLSGLATIYGPSGFELPPLSDHPIASTQSLWIQLLDNQAQPLTDRIYFDTFDDCTRNLVMVVFTRTR